MINRVVRPMVAFARLALASALCVAFMPIAFRIGPLTTMNGALPPGEAETPCSPYAVSHSARTTASTTGMYSGRQPAITAAIATFRLDADDVARCQARGLEKRLDERVRRRNDRQPVGPAVVLIELVGGERVGDVVRGGGEVHGYIIPYSLVRRVQAANPKPSYHPFPPAAYRHESGAERRPGPFRRQRAAHSGSQAPGGEGPKERLRCRLHSRCRPPGPSR